MNRNNFFKPSKKDVKPSNSSEIKESDLASISNKIFLERALILKEKSFVNINEIFPKFINSKTQKNRKKLKLISSGNFISLIKQKVKDILKDRIDFNLFEHYTIYNSIITLSNNNIDVFGILGKFVGCDKIKFDPLLITDFSNPYDMEFYWGEWSSEGKKQGFGIKIFQNGNFYFGTFLNNQPDGFGIYIFSNKGNFDYSKDISFEKFREEVYFSKQYFDLEKRRQKHFPVKKNGDEYDDENNINLKLQMKLFAENMNNEKDDYFCYIGEIKKNKLDGEGEIFHLKIGKKFIGKFSQNRILTKEKLTKKGMLFEEDNEISINF